MRKYIVLMLFLGCLIGCSSSSNLGELSTSEIEALSDVSLTLSTTREQAAAASSASNGSKFNNKFNKLFTVEQK